MSFGVLNSEAVKNILNAIHEGVCIIDKDGIVVHWSKKSETLFDVKAEKIIGKPLQDFFPTALLLNVIKTRKEANNIYLSPRKGTYVVVSARPLYFDGKFVGAISTDKDITEMTRLSYELEETRERLSQLQEEVSKLSEEKYSFGQILGRSDVIKRKIDRAMQVAKTRTGILITGESGTGKEIFARAIHQHSGRKGNFVAINCSAIPENLFESEMFGYVGGAFTGALNKGKAGQFENAHLGTMFLDEISDMPMHMQAKLLRVLQENKILRIGADTPRDIDVRIISASNKDLRKMVEIGSFREDLYYRLNVVRIDLPPLRERKEDIPILVDAFIKNFCRQNNVDEPKLMPEVFNILTSYNWEGNIRELKNTVEHLVVFSWNGKITLESVPEQIIERSLARVKESESSFDLESCVAKTEMEVIKKVMEMVEGNKSRAAKILNIPRSTLYYKLNYYRMDDLL